MTDETNNLLMAKEWLTIEETAEYLSDYFGENVSKGDIYHFALKKKILLSVIFKHQLIGQAYKKKSPDSGIYEAEVISSCFIPLEPLKPYTATIEEATKNDITALFATEKNIINPDIFWDRELFIQDEEYYYRVLGDIFDGNTGFLTLCNEEDEDENIGYYVCTPSAIKDFIYSYLSQQPEVKKAENDINTSIDNLLNHPNASEEFKALLLAWQRYWQNADRKDADTHPLNRDISEWLKSQHGVTESKAGVIASILRPEETSKGGRPSQNY